LRDVSLNSNTVFSGKGKEKKKREGGDSEVAP
jgi:hypothetical protein